MDSHPPLGIILRNWKRLERGEKTQKTIESMSTSVNKSSKNSNRRRFSDDQIRSLETTFETDSRPELRLKQHLATKLGLHPRQVAIWFQNKRARSKSKQIQGEYSVLKSNYDELASQFEALRKENQNLLVQLQRLRKMVDKGGEENDNQYQKALPSTENPRVQLDGNGRELCMPSWSSLNRTDDYLEEAHVLNTVQVAQGSLASLENGCSFESCTFLDNTGCTSQLWDF